MGIEYSTENHEGIPLTGSPTSLEVLKVAKGKWIKKETVILKLRENGSNYNITDIEGVNYFNLQKTDLQDDSMVLTDMKGREIGGFLSERICQGKRAYITVKKEGLWSKKAEGKVWAVATLNQPPGRSGNCCQIFLHNPPILTEEFDPDSMKPSLTVEGDVMLKEYDLLAGENEEQTIKIGRALHDMSELNDVKMNVAVDRGNVYYLQVGRNIDLAFIVLCAHAMDQMFFDKDLD